MYIASTRRVEGGYRKTNVHYVTGGLSGVI